MSTKVFVGNLAFRTTDQALQEAFSVCGEVKSGVIITRGRRSLGYGFVEFVSADNAAASVDKMNKTDIFGRQIKVELAKDPAERPPRSEGAEPGPAKRRRKGRDENGDAPAETQSPVPTEDNQVPSGEGVKRKRQRKPRQPKVDENGNPIERAPAPERAERAERPERAERVERTPKPAPVERIPKEKIPSKTTLFVANLPFSIDDAQLTAIFTGTKVKAAHVVCTRTGRSRGYGFVEFETEADQQEALKTTQGKEVPGLTGPRKISVSISNSVASAAPAAGSI